MLLHPVQTRLRCLLLAYLRAQQVLQDRRAQPDRQVPLVQTVQMGQMEVRVQRGLQAQLVPVERPPDLVPQVHLPALLVLLPVAPIPLKYSHSLSLLVLQDRQALLVLPDQLVQPEMTVVMEALDPQALPDLQDRQAPVEAQVPQDLLEPQQVSVHQRQALVL